MLALFADISNSNLRCIDSVEHRNDLRRNGHQICFVPCVARLPFLERKGTEVREQLYADVNEPAALEWISPVLFASKKDWVFWFGIDYRRLENAAIKDKNAFLRIDACIDFLGLAKTFTTLDADIGYWQFFFATQIIETKQL